MLNLPDPSAVAVAVDKSKVGPTPQIRPVPLAGEALVDIAKAEMRAVELAKLKGFRWKGCKAWLIDQRGDCAADDVPIASVMGITGWMLSTFPVALWFGPTSP